MKKLLLIACVALCLMSCGRQQLTPFEEALLGEPIKPVMGSVEPLQLWWTDYMPTVEMSTIDSLYFDNVLYVPVQDNVKVDIFSVCTENELPLNIIHDFYIYSGGKCLTVPVLPYQLTYSQSVEAVSFDGKTLSLRFSTEPVNPQIQVFWQNELLYSGAITPDADGLYNVDIEYSDRIGARSFLRAYIADDQHLYNDIMLPLENMHPVLSAGQLTRHDPQAQILYSIMIDRFNNGNTDNDWKINSPEVLDIVDYQGGDLKGITKKIEEGFFNELGVSTLWISPITQNPYDAWGLYIFRDNDDGTFDNKYDKTKSYTKFSAFHGYWPILSTAVDKRFGTDAELRELLDVAHKHNMNVILDYVANHLHKDSPTLLAHPDWETDSILPDGRRNFELWDEQRLTTWFDRHIPTLDLEREEIYEPMTDSAIFWIKNFEFDGFRHDACKHIPEVYWRTLTRKIKTAFPDKKLWMIGETYGSPELIGSYVKTGMLDAQFDFNLYFTAIHALIDPTGNMKDVARVIEESQKAYGAHHTMGNISGNHDQVRIASLAGGAITFEENGKEAGWTRNIGIGDPDKGYKKALLLEVLNMTVPGVPCIYQGDEYAEVGGNDPDNRHLMRFENHNKYEQDFRNSVRELISLRRNSMPLLWGDYRLITATDNVLAFERSYLQKKIVVAINKGETEESFEYNGKTIAVQPMSYVIEKQ